MILNIWSVQVARTRFSAQMDEVAAQIVEQGQIYYKKISFNFYPDYCINIVLKSIYAYVIFDAENEHNNT